jgi:hypothetical protein
MPPPRRQASELVTRYKLEPSLRYIYVEGLSDKRIFTKVFDHTGDRRAVYEIDTVDVTNEMLESVFLTRGNKQEVIALCSYLRLD